MLAGELLRFTGERAATFEIAIQLGADLSDEQLEQIFGYLDAELTPGQCRALERQMQWVVFEPNDEAFQRLVKRTFETVLDHMFVRGAFAGATPATSYQVSTSVTP